MKKYLGLQFKRPNKGYIDTVIDYRITYNSKGEIVDRKLVATHELAGFTITNYDVPVSMADRYKI